MNHFYLVGVFWIDCESLLSCRCFSGLTMNHFDLVGVFWIDYESLLSCRCFLD